MTSPAGPYKFLDYFSEEEGHRFFGRQRDVAAAVAGITKERSFVLYGPSGTGKTSLIKAGVSAELGRRGYRTVYVRVLRAPLADLEDAVARAFDAPGANSLRARLGEAQRGGPIVIVLDQFEEFFTRFERDPAARRQFVDAFAALLGDHSLDVRFVFSLREDYLAQLDVFRSTSDGRAPPELLDNRYRLGPLTAFGAREAIAKPLIAAGIEYAPELLERLVDLLARYDFDPPLLQIICSEVYREAARARGEGARLEAQDLDKIGGDEGVFQRYLDQVTAQIDKEDQLLLCGVLDALITPDRTKRAMTPEGLCTSGFFAKKDEIVRLLEILAKHRLVRGETRGDEVWYELIHDRLVRIVLAWLDRDRAFFQFRSARELVANSSRSGFWRENAETLLNEGQMAGVVGPYKERLRLDDVQLEFLVQSAIYRRSKDVAFWADRYGVERSAGLTLAMLKSEDPAVRLGAARAAAGVPDERGALSARCLEVALHDPTVDVRRAAGRALAKLARHEEIEVLSGALAAPVSRKDALEVLADMAGHGHDLGGFARAAQRKAQAIVEKRLLQRNDYRIRQLSSRGAVRGVIGGVGWTFTVGLLLACLGAWTSSTTGGWRKPLLFVLAIGTPLVIGLAAVIGWAAARSAARVAIVQGKERWFVAMLRTDFAWLALAFGIVEGVLLYVWLSGERPDIALSRSMLIGSVSGLVALLVVAVVAAQAQRAELGGEPGLRCAAWALAASGGLPVLANVTFTALVGGLYSGGEWPIEWIIAAFLGVGLSSVAAGVAVLALAGARDREESEDSNSVKVVSVAPIRGVVVTGPIREARRIILGAATVAALWMALQLRPDTIPLLAPHFALPSAVPTSDSWPYVRYVKVRTDDPRGALMRVSEARDHGVWLRDRSLAEMMVLVPPSSIQELAIVREVGRHPEGKTDGIRLTDEPWWLPQERIGPATVFAQIELTSYFPAGGRWSSRLSGTTDAINVSGLLVDAQAIVHLKDERRRASRFAANLAIKQDGEKIPRAPIDAHVFDGVVAASWQVRESPQFGPLKTSRDGSFDIELEVDLVRSTFDDLKNVAKVVLIVSLSGADPAAPLRP